jgi:hypothetical protein
MKYSSYCALACDSHILAALMDSLLQFTEVSVRLFVFFMLSNIVN